MHDDQPKVSEARAETARRNGALSRGPATPEGKARSALNATRHGLCARTMVPGEGEAAGELIALRAALLARWRPLDAAEAHLVEELVFAAWRQIRLRAVEDAVLVALSRGPEQQAPGLPSLATLIRYRGRIDRDIARASEELAHLRRHRGEKIADPMRLRWLAERIEAAQALIQAGQPSPAPAGTGEPDEPVDQDFTNELGGGTDEPKRPPQADETPLQRGGFGRASESTNELGSGTNEPTQPVASPLNRHQRRRLAALQRRAA
jgi:hypothetical protein